MKPEYRQNWEAFMAGRWTAQRPDKPGRYLVCENTSPMPVTIGAQARTLRLIEDLDRKLKPEGVDNFSGYWWSVALPDMPPCTES